MKVMLYRWGSYCDPPLILALETMGTEVIIFEKKMKDYHADAEFALEFASVLRSSNADLVISFDYFPLIASLCKINNVPYCSWVYDCPLFLLNSKTLPLNANHVFCFDRTYAIQLQERGAKHCYHFPLGVSTEYFTNVIRKASEIQKEKFRCDVSFVGNFYNGKKNRVRGAKLNAHTKGYLDGLIEAQSQIYGCSLLKDVLTKEIVEEVATACELELGDLYTYEPEQLVADAVGVEVSARERERIVQAATEVAQIHIYTGSELPEKLIHSGNVIECGYVDYQTEMPLIFHESKINLNMTHHTITSGIPQRVLDILACGGFCLTNYQPEIDEYFVDGEELVMYAGKEDAREKIAYYLAHEDERKEIARRGYEKVVAEFGMEKRVQEMLNILEEEHVKANDKLSCDNK